MPEAGNKELGWPGEEVKEYVLEEFNRIADKEGLAVEDNIEYIELQGKNVPEPRAQALYIPQENSLQFHIFDEEYQDDFHKIAKRVEAEHGDVFDENVISTYKKRLVVEEGEVRKIDEGADESKVSGLAPIYRDYKGNTETWRRPSK